MMNAPIDTGSSFVRGLRGYVTAVAAELGVGWESCALDLDTPVSAYIAMDWRLNRFPDRDAALLWDERHGWAVAVETHSGEDLIVLAYLGGGSADGLDSVVANPRVVTRFLSAVRAGDHSVGQPDPPALRPAGNHDELTARFTRFVEPVAA